MFTNRWQVVMSTAYGMLFDIQHCSLHDGPGIRSTVFFKGCPLACRWCANPESQDAAPQLMFFRNLCASCGSCERTCPQGASSLTADGLAINRDICIGCGACVAPCPTHARQLSGRVMTVKEVCDEVRQYWRIFQHSGGGVTFSGGESLAQPDFLFELLQTIHDGIGLHTCLDTCGMADRTTLERMLPYLDMVLLDLKHMDSGIHKAATRAGNETVLANARTLARSTIPVVVRVPLIPGFNDTDANLNALGAFLKEHALFEAEIMPYHTLGLNKYAALGKTCAFHADSPPRTEAAVEILKRYDIAVLVHQFEQGRSLATARKHDARCRQRSASSPVNTLGDYDETA